MHVAIQIYICYNADRHKNYIQWKQKEQNPGSTANTSRVYSSFTEKSTVLAWLPLIYPVKPFANVIGSYTCQHGDKKIKNYIQMKAPPSCHQYGDGNKYSIAVFDKKHNLIIYKN